MPPCIAAAPVVEGFSRVASTLVMPEVQDQQGTVVLSCELALVHRNVPLLISILSIGFEQALNQSNLVKGV